MPYTRNMKRWLEDFFSMPSRLLEEGIQEGELVEKKVVNKRPLKLAEEYWHTLGPGLTTGAADDDPSGIATYSQTGATYGTGLLWLAAWTFPLMAVIQEMCARIGIVTGRGLAANIKHHYSRPVLYFITALLFAANTFNIGADLGAMAQAVQLFAPSLGIAFLVIAFACVSLGLQIFTTYARYAKYLKYLALVLFAYVASALLSHLDWSAVARAAIIPTLTFSRGQIFLICGILGTTISPYLFFWQTSQEVEEQHVKNGKNGHEVGWHEHPTAKEVSRLRTDVWSGMFFSNAAMFFIIAACAGTLYAHGVTNIATAADAAAALRPIAGDGAFYLFAIGIIGVGLLAIPVLAGSTSYALSESFGWPHGLYRKLKEAQAFYGVIIVSMVLGIGMNFLGLDPIKVLIYSAVANGIVAPFILILIVLLASKKSVMQEYVNGPIARTVGWLTVGLMAIVGLATIWSLFG